MSRYCVLRWHNSLSRSGGSIFASPASGFSVQRARVINEQDSEVTHGQNSEDFGRRRERLLRVLAAATFLFFFRPIWLPQ
jgi:hypothetical protein